MVERSAAWGRSPRHSSRVRGRATRATVAARAGLGLLLLVGCGIGDDGSGGSRPDVLVVVLDTVRADRTSTYGYERPTTIQLDAVARAGVVFEDVTAPASWTWPSHASLFTGQPPWVHGAHLTVGPSTGRTARVNDAVTVTALRDDLPTLAERFASAGYRTRAVVVNGWLDPDLGLMRGFERVAVFDRDALAVNEARAVIGREDGRPLFLFVNLLSAHSPYREGPGTWSVDDPRFLDPLRAPEWIRPYLLEEGPAGVHLSQRPDGADRDGVVRYYRGELDIPDADLEQMGRLYDVGVRAADFSLGRILDAWVTAHPHDIVAVTSDHGEGFGEHGLLTHGASVYPEVLRVPLVVSAPDRLPQGIRVPAPVLLQDLHPTLLDLAGIEPSSRSLVRRVEGEGRNGPVTAAAWPNEVWARAVGGRFETTWHLYRDARDALVWSESGDAELYAVAADPGMRRDRAAEEPERVSTLLARARRDLAQSRAEVPEVVLEIPEPMLERLRALGYAAE